MSAPNADHPNNAMQRFEAAARELERATVSHHVWPKQERVDRLTAARARLTGLYAEAAKAGGADDVGPTCSRCGGPHPFDTSVPSVVWNAAVRERGLPDYLCLTCIVRAFAHQGRSFTAQLWGDGFDGLVIEVLVDGQEARDATAISDENTQLRAHIVRLEEVIALNRLAVPARG